MCGSGRRHSVLHNRRCWSSPFILASLEWIKQASKLWGDTTQPRPAQDARCPIGRNTDMEDWPCAGGAHCHESTGLGKQGVSLAIADDDDAGADDKQGAA